MEIRSKSCRPRTQVVSPKDPDAAAASCPMGEEHVLAITTETTRSMTQADRYVPCHMNVGVPRFHVGVPQFHAESVVFHVALCVSHDEMCEIMSPSVDFMTPCASSLTL